MIEYLIFNANFAKCEFAILMQESHISISYKTLFHIFGYQIIYNKISIIELKKI
jgi:hypothetical protein